LLFTLSFEHSIVPNVWLKLYITPIFKKCNPCDPTNYRPISLTATICKLIETIIKDQLVQYLVNKGHINKHHAFIKNHSTATNLLECMNDWLVSIKSPNRTDVVYIYFSKAFNSIVTSKLLYKLESCGVTGLLLKWIECFLSNRIQCIVLDHTYSSFNKIISGCQQGSVLGPILFLLYKIVCCGHTKLQLFVDDAKLYSIINIDATSVSLQQSLDNLAAWFNDWQLVINISKRAVLSISTTPSMSHTYHINGIDLFNHSSCIDLGVV
jgi:Reverse transcriptase (RNA-dependent DNA polymerase)